MKVTCDIVAHIKERSLYTIHRFNQTHLTLVKKKNKERKLAKHKKN